MRNSDVWHFAQRYLSALDSPESLAVYLLGKYGEWEQIAVKRTDPRSYNDVCSFRGSYLATELLRKFPGLPIEADRVENARKAFFAAEAECARTNVRLSPYVDDPSSEDTDIRITEFIRGVKRRIRRVLGRLPADLDIRFGPGSTFETAGHPCADNLVLGDKLELGIHLTPSASCLQDVLYRTAWGREWVRAAPSQSGPTFVPGNRFFTVPKDATIDRGACAEPGGNVALQLAVGRVLRERLRLNAGIDLVRGQEVHGRMARLASRDADHATIDLKSASDTLSRKLVQLLLPGDWFALLMSCRSAKTRLQGRWYWLEKFSSMGNGFTFELETLVFWAISSEAAPGTRVYVYGDDIIVRSEYAQGVCSALRWCGFTTNPRKTFTDSYFRESCGTDSFNGVEITAFRLDADVDSPAAWISVHNGVERALFREEKSAAQQFCVERLPKVARVFGPTGLGDLALHNDNVRSWTLKFKDGIRFVRVWKPVLGRVELEHHRPCIQYALALYGIPSTGQSPRGVIGYRWDWVPYS